MSQSRRESTVHAVVVGMGPVGLACAFEMAKNTKQSVLIIEKRSEADAFLRPQVVVVDSDSKNQLLAMIGKNEQLDDDDLHFLNHLFGSAEVPIGMIQKFILNRIKNLNREHGDTPLISMRYEVEPVSVDLTQGKIQIKKAKEEGIKEEPGEEDWELVHSSGEIIKFQQMIAADGASSGTLEKVNANLAKKQRVDRTTPFAMSYLENSYHLGTYVTVSTDGMPALPNREFVSSFLENPETGSGKSPSLYFLRFDRKTYDLIGANNVALGCISEIPKELYEQLEQLNTEIRQLDQQIQELREKPLNDAKEEGTPEEDWEFVEALGEDKLVAERAECVERRKELAIGHTKKCIADYLKQDVAELKVEITESTPAVDKLKILAFQGESKRANKAAMEVNGHGLYLVGDAYFTPNYLLGHGLNDGLSASRKLGELDDAKVEQHISEYNHLTSKKANDAILRMQGIRFASIFQNNLWKLPSRKQITKIFEQVVEEEEQYNKITRWELRDVKSLLNAIESKFTCPPLPDANKIKEWETFLEKNETIVRLYRREIGRKLKSIDKIMAQSNELPDLKKLFTELHDKYTDLIRRWNTLMANTRGNMNLRRGHTPLYDAVLSAETLDVAAVYVSVYGNPFKKISVDPNYSPLELSLCDSFINMDFALYCLQGALNPDPKSDLHQLSSALTGDELSSIERLVTDRVETDVEWAPVLGLVAQLRQQWSLENKKEQVTKTTRRWGIFDKHASNEQSNAPDQGKKIISPTNKGPTH